MAETVWFRIVGKKRTTRDEVLPARSGRFHEDSKSEPTSYLGDSLMTVWKEAQAARAGAARLDLGAFAGWRVTIDESQFVDFRDPKERKKWHLSEAELIGIPAPPKCLEVARSMRASRASIQGILYKSVRHAPSGVCLALFLDRGPVISSFEQVPEKDWKEFVERLARQKE